MKVYVDVHDKRWNKYKIDFEKIANTAVSGVCKDSEVSIILVNDDEICEINRTYRNIDKPTNVLSFELGDDVLLGDIYISLDTVKREAEAENISVSDHVAHMVVHGVLHLLGYDHITDDEAQIMEFKETKILKKMGIKNPYADECADASCCPGGKLVSFFNRINVRENSFWQYALYALFGGVASFGFAPFYQWWMTLLGVGGAYWMTIKNNKLGGFWKSLLRVAPFGAVYAVAMFWWVLHSIYVVPELMQQFAIWTVPGLVGLAIAGTLIFSWPFVAVARIKTSAAARVFLFAGVWALVLWAREWVMTGFPWNPIANISMPMPMLANSMALWGAVGLTFVIIGFVASLVEVLRNKKSKSSWCVFVIFVLLLIVGGLFGRANMRAADVGATDATGPMIRIVQPSISQAQKATHNRAQALENAAYNLRNQIALANETGEYDILVLPETAYPFAVLPDDDIEIARIVGRPIVMGANTVENGAVFNSMVVADESGKIVDIYNKSHLVPFGEYRPLGFLPAPVNLGAGNGPVVMGVGGFVFAPAVCYEVIFSDSLIPDGVGHIDAVLNITNDNWFGNTPGVYQHLDMVRRYAIESGLPIVRANYSGISAFVASDGAIISALPVGAVGVLDGFVWGAHKTPYRVIGLNMWMIFILMFSVIGAVVFAKKRD